MRTNAWETDNEIRFYCPACRDAASQQPMDETWEHTGTESFLTVLCPVCGYRDRFGPI